MIEQEKSLSIQQQPSEYRKQVLVEDYGFTSRAYYGLIPSAREKGGFVIDQMITANKNNRDDILGFRVTRARRFLVRDNSGSAIETEEINPASRSIWISYEGRPAKFLTKKEAKAVSSRGKSALDWATLATVDGVVPHRVVQAWNGNFYPAGQRDRIRESNNPYPRHY